MISTPRLAVADAVDIAIDQLGRPYHWGAVGPERFDCSGLTRFAFSAVGIQLPRTSAEQSQSGTVVEGPLRRGDLLFFATADDRPGVVTHVGIFEGDNVMVDANWYSNSVTRDDITINYWTSRFLFARRLVSAPPPPPPPPLPPVTWNGNGHSYELFLLPSDLSWDEASRQAAARGGYLATITSQAEQDFVWAQFGPQLSFEPVRALAWLGGHLSPSGSWTWVTGEAWSYSNWGIGEPNGGATPQDWLTLGRYPDGGWNDTGYTQANGYLVERDLTGLPPPAPAFPQIRQLSDTTGWLGISAPAISRDGSTVAFVGELTAGTGGRIFVAQTDAGLPVPITPPELKVMSGHGERGLALGGRRLAFQACSPNCTFPPDLYVVNIDGTGLQQLTSDGSLRSGVAPVISGDGTKVAFIRRAIPPQQPADTLFILDLSTGQETVLWGPIGAGNIGPVSADGTGNTVVFQQRVDFGTGPIFRLSSINTDGSGLRTLRDFPLDRTVSDLAISGDGNYAAYIAGGGLNAADPL